MSPSKNLIYLFGIQAGNSIFPLLLFPYLLYSLDNSIFAIIVTTEAIALVILTVSLYGFDVVGLIKLTTKENNNNEKDSRIYYGILYSRILIYLSTSIAIACFLFAVNSEKLPYLIAWLLYPLGVILQSTYFFQGKENNFPVAAAVITSRIISCIVIYILVTNRQEPIWILVSLSSSFLISGLALASFAIARYDLKPVRISLQDLINTIKAARHPFFSSASVLLYRGSNIIVLSILSIEPTAIALYSIAEKYTKNIQSISLPLSQHYSTKLARELNLNKSQVTNSIYKFLKPQLVLVGTILIGSLIVSAFFWTNIPEHVKNVLTLMAIMIPAIFFGVANFMLGTIALNTLNAEKIYSQVIFLIGLASIIASVYLSSIFSTKGAALVYGLSELSLTIVISIIIKKRFG